MVRTPPEMRRHGTVGRDIRSSLRAGWQILQAIVIFALIAYVIWHGAAAMDYGWQWYRVEPFFYRVVDGEIIWGPLIRGLVMTLKLAAISAVIAIAIAIGFVTALARLSGSIAGRAIATCYLEVIRNTPLLVQLFLFYFVLAPIFDIDRFWAGVLCLAAFEGSFAAEIIRPVSLASIRDSTKLPMRSGWGISTSTVTLSFPSRCR